MNPSGNREEPVHGLDRIAKLLKISLRQLHRLMERPAGDRPPIRHSHRGYYAYPSRLQQWVDVEDVDAGLHREMKLLRQEQPVARSTVIKRQKALPDEAGAPRRVA